MNSAFPKFSIVIPARNASRTMAMCLDSLRRLDPGAVEVIVVDDASTDDTSEIARAHGARVVRLVENLVPGLARNEGVRVAEGEYLAFTDADCSVPPDWLGRFDEALRDGSHVAATGPYAGTTEKLFLTVLIDFWLRFNQRHVPARIESCITANLSVRKADFEAVGGFPAYRLPGAKLCCFTNEDEELARFLSRATSKFVAWLPSNGVFHAYRATLPAFFAQQAKYVESILVTYARFPFMMKGRTYYSRGGGTMQIVTSALFLFCAAAAFRLPRALFGCLPFLITNFGTVRYLHQNGATPAMRLRLAAAAYPFLMMVSIAWMKGAVTGFCKALIGTIYWRRAGYRSA